MVGKTKALVLSGYGINCPTETKYAIDSVGGNATIHHINELLDKPAMLEEYNFFVIPGGFSFGDDISSGKVLANKIRYGFGDQLLEFIKSGKLVLGICNGFQALVKMGLLPWPDFEQRVTITYNESGKFEDRWAYLKINQNSPCIFTKEIEEMVLPIRHGEGRFIPATKEVLDKLVNENLHVMQYVDAKGNLAGYPANPNGAVMNIAGICDPSGQIFGLMPHPEAYNHRTNHPCWSSGVGTTGQGLSVFRNAVTYLEKEW